MKSTPRVSLHGGYCTCPSSLQHVCLSWIFRTYGCQVYRRRVCRILRPSDCGLSRTCLAEVAVCACLQGLQEGRPARRKLRKLVPPVLVQERTSLQQPSVRPVRPSVRPSRPSIVRVAAGADRLGGD